MLFGLANHAVDDSGYRRFGQSRLIEKCDAVGRVEHRHRSLDQFAPFVFGRDAGAVLQPAQARRATGAGRHRCKPLEQRVQMLAALRRRLRRTSWWRIDAAIDPKR